MTRAALYTLRPPLSLLPLGVLAAATTSSMSVVRAGLSKLNAARRGVRSCADGGVVEFDETDETESVDN